MAERRSDGQRRHSLRSVRSSLDRYRPSGDAGTMDLIKCQPAGSVVLLRTSIPPLEVLLRTARQALRFRRSGYDFRGRSGPRPVNLVFVARSCSLAFSASKQQVGSPSYARARSPIGQLHLTFQIVRSSLERCYLPKVRRSMSELDQKRRFTPSLTTSGLPKLRTSRIGTTTSKRCQRNLGASISHQ
jgi:hypothetical protein